MCVAAVYLASISARLPMPTIWSPFTATAPSSRMRAIRVHGHHRTSGDDQVGAYLFSCGIAGAVHVLAHTRKAQRYQNRRLIGSLLTYLRFERISEAGSVKGLGKKSAHLDHFHFAFEVGKDHRDVATEFPDELAARAAGRGQRFGVGHYGNGVETALAFADGFEDRDAFGADGQSIRGVFDVAPAKDSAGSGGGERRRRENWNRGHAHYRALAWPRRSNDRTRSRYSPPKFLGLPRGAGR